MTFDSSIVLRAHKLRDTLPRRLTLSALHDLHAPADCKTVLARIRRRQKAVNLVTVYRMLDRFETLGIVHKHPSSGKYTLCSLPDAKGHHGFLSCRKCGRVKEFADSDLCKKEDRIAQRAGFLSESHVSDIVGLCSSCH